MSMTLVLGETLIGRLRGQVGHGQKILGDLTYKISMWGEKGFLQKVSDFGRGSYKEGTKLKI